IDRLVLPLQRGRLGGPSRVPGLGRAARCHGHGRHGARRRRRRLYDPPRARAHARGPRQRSGAAAAGAAHAGGAAVNRPFAPQAVTAPPRPSLAVLAAVSALQPFALNVLAPATPALARTFVTDYATIQLTLGLYLLAVAVTQVVIGPISDRFGRRPCVLGGVALFTIGSFAGAFAVDTVTLLAARVVQAAGGGTAFALARAIVRDTSGRDEAASRIGYLTMVMVVAPMVAPFVGGVIDAQLGWRAIFGAKAVFGLAVLVYALAVLGETAPKTHLTSVGDMLRAFPLLLGDRGFLGYTLSLC